MIQTCIPFGKKDLPIRLDSSTIHWHVLQEPPVSVLQDQQATFMDMCRNPLGTKPISELFRREDRLTIVTTDNTRPLPNQLLLTWLLEVLPVDPKNITILIGTGSHRPVSEQEIFEIFGDIICNSVQIINHDSSDPAACMFAGNIKENIPVFLNRKYLDADKRLLLGLIEPHFFAGYSGGPKGIFPAIGSLESILHNHRFESIDQETSTFLNTDRNLVFEEMSLIAALCPPDFAIQVILNRQKQISHLLSGDYMATHREGCRLIRSQSTLQIPHPVEMTVVTNNGFPLDRNLYQCVKGLAAAARMTRLGGTIILSAECVDGVPPGSTFHEILTSTPDVKNLKPALISEYYGTPDAWQVQILCRILENYTVRVFSSIDDDTIRACHMQPIKDLQEILEMESSKMKRGSHAAVLPFGPQFIPVLDPQAMTWPEPGITSDGWEGEK